MDPRRVDMIGRGLLLVCLAAFVLLLFHRGVRPLLHARRDLGSFREAGRIVMDARGTLDQLSLEIDQFTQEIEANEARLPRSANLDLFLERLESSARETHVHVQQLAPRAVGDRGLFREQQVEVRVTGSFPQIYAMLDRLERSDHLSRIEQLSIAGTEGEPRCAADIRLALYFAPGERE
jgi:hypothetical protein